jgi:hypothetical protein
MVSRPALTLVHGLKMNSAEKVGRVWRIDEAVQSLDLVSEQPRKLRINARWIGARESFFERRDVRGYLTCDARAQRCFS